MSIIFLVICVATALQSVQVLGQNSSTTSSCTTRQRFLGVDQNFMIGFHHTGADNAKLFEQYSEMEEKNCIETDVWGFWMNAGYLNQETGHIVNQNDANAISKAMNERNRHAMFLIEPKSDAGDAKWMFKKIIDFDERFWTSFLEGLKQIVKGSTRKLYLRILHEANNEWTCYEWTTNGKGPFCEGRNWFWEGESRFQSPEQRRHAIGDFWKKLKELGGRIGFANLDISMSYDANHWTPDEGAIDRGINEVKADLNTGDSVGIDFYSYTNNNGNDEINIDRFKQAMRKLDIGNKAYFAEVGSKGGAKTCDLIRAAKETGMGGAIMWIGPCSGGNECSFDLKMKC